MKKITKKHFFLVAVLLPVFAAAGAYGYFWYRFDKAYRAYDALAKEHASAAYFPGAPNNPLRQELDRALVTVLAEGAPPELRMEVARRASSLLLEYEATIDIIGEAGERATKALDAAESYAWGADRKGLISKARERAEIIADIRGLSYRADYHTAEIFHQIVRDDGELTEEHVRALNSQIPAVEEQFNKRTNLYGELGRVDAEIAELYAGLGIY